MSDEGSFRRERQAPSASVIIRTDGGDDRTVGDAIRHLVAAAIPNMKTDEVTVLNVDGRLLASGPDDLEKSPDNLLGLEKEVSQELREKITTTLAPYLSLHNFQVSVAAQLNADKTQTNETIYNPDQRVERSVRVVKDKQNSQNSGESLHKDTYDKYITPREQSYRPFQLNRSGGLGAVFERETAAERKRLGLGDLTDPRTIGLQTAWVAKYIAAGRSMAPWRGGNHPLREADPKWGNSGYVAGATPIGSSDTNGRAQTGAATAATSGRDYSGLNILPDMARLPAAMPSPA